MFIDFSKDARMRDIVFVIYHLLYDITMTKIL